VGSAEVRHGRSRLQVTLLQPRPAGSSRGQRLGPAGFALLLLMALTLAALVPAPATAQAPPGFVGTQALTDPTDEEFRRLGSAGITTYRHNIVWRYVEGHRGHYAWARYDRLFARAARKGVRVMPVLVGSPRWANRDVHHPPTTYEGRQAYYRFVGAVVKRYGPTGQLWKTQPRASAAFAARNFQIWNEPNLPNWWNDDPDPVEYVRLLKGAAREARMASPAAEIVMAGIPETRHPRVISIASFLRSVYRVPGAREAFDYVAVHPYARTPTQVVDLVERTRAAVNAGGDRETKIWVTEFGWATGGGHPDFSVSSARQASYLRSTLRELLSRRGSLGVRGALWYLFRDSPELGSWQSRTGLRTASDAAKPAWRALVDIARPTR